MNKSEFWDLQSGVSTFDIQNVLITMVFETAKEAFNFIKDALKNYDSREASSIAFLILEKFGYSRNDVLSDKKLTSDLNEELPSILQRLNKSEPIQYILGSTEFYGYPFYVNSFTLIPRPETEELVHLIIKDTKGKSSSILDIGTGSGCIAISLAKELSHAAVSALDTSKGALEIAQRNAFRNEVKVQFYHIDVLSNETERLPPFDIIVSNPPYIRESERSLMNSNVLDYEPESALFVSDNDPLIFYRTIAELALKKLTSGGLLYFEINESLGKEMIEMLEKLEFKNIELLQDINGKNRMIKCGKPF